MIAIIASRSDPAAMNIARALIEGYGFREANGKGARYDRGDISLFLIDGEATESNGIDKRLGADAIIFASRHRSAARLPCLTIHATGNPMGCGASAKGLAMADPIRMKVALRALSEVKSELGLEEFLVSLEATHHGPTELDAPSFFAEIGSSEEDWSNPEAGEAVSRAIFSAASLKGSGIPSVGFGGGHYSMKHTRAELDSEYAIGHIFPKYFFEGNFSKASIELAFRRTSGNCSTALLDWKGIKGPQRRALLEALEEMGIEAVRI
ncbi:MAG: D-aminoacyl-tRNA deacylase [Candidatus Bathyarchaeia archaeon]